MEDVDKILSVRLNQKQIDEIDTIVRINPDKYSSISHFIRAAVIKELRRFEQDTEK